MSGHDPRLLVQLYGPRPDELRDQLYAQADALHAQIQSACQCQRADALEVLAVRLDAARRLALRLREVLQNPEAENADRP